MTYRIYGIKACDTMKKAMNWLEQQGVEFEFHDYKKQAIDQESLERWCNEHGWETILNRRGTSFRQVAPERKENLDQAKAIELMLENNSMIKRPVLDLGSRTLVGFKDETYQSELQA